MKKDNPIQIFLSNIPNMLSVARIILTFVVMYMIFTEAPMISVIIVFAVAALTDFLDGRLARRFKWTSEFGRKTDMIADRFLWIGTALAFIINFGIRRELSAVDGVQLLFIMSREMISMPFAVSAFFSGKPIPHARYIAKVTTFLQAFALPTIMISVSYSPMMYFSIPVSLATGICGIISGLYYMYDLENPVKNMKKR